MVAQFFTIGILMLFSAMLPGPDFAMVTKNTLIHSRRSGLFTSLGVGTAILVHITYCALGLAVVISKSILLFSFIKYLGAGYLIYIGVSALLSKQSDHIAMTGQHLKKSEISNWLSFRQGFLCNLLNPKATLFFMALFTVIIKPETPVLWLVIYAAEMFVILTAWFCCLTMILSHPRVTRILGKAEKFIAKATGVFLIGFGAALAFVKNE